MMTSAQVVETSVNVTSNSPSQDYTHPDDHNLPNYDMTPGFKPFTVLNYLKSFIVTNLPRLRLIWVDSSGLMKKNIFETKYPFL